MGRVANRIAKGLFVVDGVEYKLDTNNGPNAIHGGLQGFSKVSPDVLPELVVIAALISPKNPEEPLRTYWQLGLGGHLLTPEWLRTPTESWRRRLHSVDASICLSNGCFGRHCRSGKGECTRCTFRGGGKHGATMVSPVLHL